MRLPIVLALSLVCACTSAKNGVELAVGAAALEPAKRDAVRTLTVDVAGAITASKSYDVTGLRAEERLELIPSISSGTLSITVTAIDDRTNVVGRGSTDVTLTGERVRAGVTLSASAVSISVAPTQAKVTRTRTQRFVADKQVVWSVSSGGGAIDTDGVYTAPDAPGSATVTATLATDETVTVSIPVEIADYGIELVAGPSSGPGWADGVGGSARFSSPMDLALTAAGDFLYVAERDGCLIRKIEVSSSTVSTFAGRFNDCQSVDGTATAARFNYPQALTLDEGAGLLYVAEVNGIRTVRLSDGQVSTILSTPGIGSVGGMVLHPTNRHLYFTLSNRHIVTSVDLAAPALSTIAGTNNAAGSSDGTGTSASFRSPRGIATDGTSLFVADMGNATLRQIDLGSQAVTTVAGVAGMKAYVNGDVATSRLLGPTALAYASGAVRFLDCDLAKVVSSSCLVRTFVVANKSVSLLAGQLPATVPNEPNRPAPSADSFLAMATFADAFGLALFPSGNFVYVSERTMGTIRKVPLAGGLTSTIAGTAVKYGSTDGVGSLARFWQPSSMARVGNLVYLSDDTNSVVRSIDAVSGEVKTVAGAAGVLGAVEGSATVARFKRPEAMTVMGRTLYVSDADDPTLRTIDLDTGNVSLLAGQHGAIGTTDGVGLDARFTYPLYFANDGTRYLYLTESTTVRRIDTTNGAVVTLAGSPPDSGYQDGVGSAARFGNAYGIAFENGLLYVCDVNNRRIRTLDPQTNEVATFLGGDENVRVDGVGDAVRFSGPTICTSDGRGHLFVADAGAIRRVDIASRTVTTLVGRPEMEQSLRLGPLPGALNEIGGMIVEESGDLVITEYRASSVVRLRIPQ